MAKDKKAKEAKKSEKAIAKSGKETKKSEKPQKKKKEESPTSPSTISEILPVEVEENKPVEDQLPKGQIEDGEFCIWLDEYKRIAIGPFKDKLRVDIRTMYKDKSGLMKPTQKGVSLTPKQLKQLKNVDLFEVIQAHFPNYKIED